MKVIKGLDLAGVMLLARSEGYARCLGAVRKGKVWTIKVTI